MDPRELVKEVPVQPSPSNSTGFFSLSKRLVSVATAEFELSRGFSHFSRIFPFSMCEAVSLGKASQNFVPWLTHEDFCVLLSDPCHMCAKGTGYNHGLLT